MNEKALRSHYDNATLEMLAAKHYIEVRRNPKRPRRKQYRVATELPFLEILKRHAAKASVRSDAHAKAANLMPAEQLGVRARKRRHPKADVSLLMNAQAREAVLNRMNTKRLRSNHDNTTVAKTAGQGSLHARQHPGVPDREQPALRSHGNATVAKTAGIGSLRGRQHPGVPDREQPALRTDSSPVEEERRSRHVHGWMSDATVGSLFDNATVAEMIANGSLRMRRTAAMPGRIRFWLRTDLSPIVEGQPIKDLNVWMSDASLHSQYDETTVAEMIANGTVQVRQNPDVPQKKQYRVRTDLTPVEEGMPIDDMEGWKSGAWQRIGFTPPIWRAPATEVEYKAVAQKQDDALMKDFILRVIDEMGLESRDDAALTGFVPWFSGTAAVQSLEALRKEVAASTWVGPKT